MTGEGGLRRLLEAYRPPTRRGRLLALGAGIDSIGTGLFMSLLPLYLVLHLDIAPPSVGIAIGTANGVGMAGAVIAGQLIDRFGAGRLWFMLVLLRLLGYAGYLFVSSFWSFLLLTCVLVPLDRSSGVAQQAFVVATECPDHRNRTMAGIRTSRNVGMSLGLMCSAVVAASGTAVAYRIAFGSNAISYAALLVAVVAVLRLDAAPATPAIVDQTDLAGRRAWDVVRDRRYLRLTTGDALLMLHDSLLFVLFPLWVVARADLSEAFVGPLLALNTVLTVALQLPLSRWASDVSGAREAVRWAIAPLIGSCAMFALAEELSTVAAATTLVVAVVALTVGENLHSVGAFELSHRLAPADQVGSYLGIFSLGNSAQLMVGPAVMTTVVLASPVGWIIVSSAFAGGGVLMVTGSASRGRASRTKQKGPM